MQRLLVRAGKATAAYAAGAVVAVVISRLLGKLLWGLFAWVPVVVYVGPAVYFIALLIMNRGEFHSIRSTGPRWGARAAVCAVLTAVSTFVVWVFAVNVHLLLGGGF
jgi:hypothetical protein